MGCGQSVSDDIADQRAVSRSIDKEIWRTDQIKRLEVKLLLLGTGASGKSTVARQMKVLFLNGFTDHELQTYAPVLRFNLVNAVVRPLEFCLQAYPDGAEWEDESLAEMALEYSALADSEAYAASIPENVIADWRKLVSSEMFSRLLDRGREYVLDDSSRYFYEHMERFAKEDYVPSSEDILRMRVITTAISEVPFQYEDTWFRVVDVGGQRNERRKWLHCFSGVKAVLYVLAVHEYDMQLVEDATVNRMHEALKLFDDMVNCQYFENTPFIVFLNKCDLVKEKLKRGITPAVIFPDYKGGTNYDKCIAYLRKKFISLANRPPSQLYAYETVAVDTTNIDLIFKTVKSIILNESLDQI